MPIKKLIKPIMNNFGYEVGRSIPIKEHLDFAYVYKNTVDVRDVTVFDVGAHGGGEV